MKFGGVQFSRSHVIASDTETASILFRLFCVLSNGYINNLHFDISAMRIIHNSITLYFNIRVQNRYDNTYGWLLFIKYVGRLSSCALWMWSASSMIVYMMCILYCVCVVNVSNKLICIEQCM